MNYLLTLILCAVQFVSLAQYNPKNYHAFDGKTQVIFHDDFDDDRNGWIALDSTDTTSTNKYDVNSNNNKYIDGNLQINTTGNYVNSFEAYEIESAVDYTRNYEITINARIIKKSTGKKKRVAGVLYWAREKYTINGYNLYFSNRKKISIFNSHTRFKDSVNRKSRKYTWALSCFNKDDYNLYTIRKYEGKIYLFVNGRYTCSIKAVETKGNVLGIGGTMNDVTLFDRITIAYLP